MKITFLGTSGSMITVDRVNISILVDTNLLLDAGEGATHATQRLQLSAHLLFQIDRIGICRENPRKSRIQIYGNGAREERKPVLLRGGMNRPPWN
jgi:hypothetical protein